MLFERVGFPDHAEARPAIPLLTPYRCQRSPTELKNAGNLGVFYPEVASVFAREICLFEMWCKSLSGRN